MKKSLTSAPRPCEKIENEVIELTKRNPQEIKEGFRVLELLKNNVHRFGKKYDIHLSLFLTAPSIARILWLNNVYLEGINIPGIFVEFGSQWGASFNIILMLKLIHEPWNASRKILSFSQYEEGLNDVAKKDGKKVIKGSYAVSASWKNELEQIVRHHCMHSPIGARENYDIIPGDARLTFRKYLKDNPHTIISHAHFDMDLYKPTKEILKLVIDYMPKGGIIIFDEINCSEFPGETIAINEVIGIKNLKLIKSKYSSYSAYYKKE